MAIRNVILSAPAMPDDPQFKKWFGNSKVKKMVYHASNKPEVRKIDNSIGELGLHFGSKSQAKSRMEFVGGEGGGKWEIHGYWLRVERPLRLEDFGSFHADYVAEQLAEKGLMTEEEAKKIAADIKKNPAQTKKHNPKIVALIKKAGYDGIVYKNELEGYSDSWIIFDSDQMKRAQ